ncbi:MAG: sensor histidine kinase [Betaproteobacteria bacterium]|nr:sensor histidine kinase [Betaproteobacteria bacterium]
MQLQVLACLWLCLVPLCAAFWLTWLRSLLLWGSSLHALFMLRLAWTHRRQHATWPRALYAGVWLVYASSVLVYWLYRLLEWPLFTTLGIQFVQGALVATLLGLSASMQVIGESQRLQEAMVLSRARAHWFAATQHDLWQPLQSIQLYVQALLTAPAAQRPQLVNGLELASQSVDDFMSQLRYFAEGECLSSTTPSTSKVLIHDVLQPLVDEYRPLAQMRHLVLRYRPADAWVGVDPRAVQRMVRNLLTNALHYTPAGGRVLLACRRRGPRLWVLCIDNGMGMRPAQIDSSFEAFNAVEGSPGHAHKLGLGLFSVKQLALQHQMPTCLQSEQGRGTCVGFGMPLADKSAEV